LFCFVHYKAVHTNGCAIFKHSVAIASSFIFFYSISAIAIAITIVPISLSFHSLVPLSPVSMHSLFSWILHFAYAFFFSIVIVKPAICLKTSTLSGKTTVFKEEELFSESQAYKDTYSLFS
jgi:hypothetical protein